MSASYLNCNIAHSAPALAGSDQKAGHMKLLRRSVDGMGIDAYGIPMQLR
jgi:hypothetical protein